MLTRKSLSMVLVTAVALSMVARTARADNEKGTAVIKGKAVFEGAVKTKGVKIANDPVCVKAHPKKRIPAQGTIVYKKQNNALPYVFVYVKGIKGKYDQPAAAVVLDQQGCMYHPHVFGMVVGQEIDIKNSDSTNHNVHALPRKNAQFNFAQPNVGLKKLTGRDTFTKSEYGKNAIKIKCDVHPWMGAWCHVMTHPFFDVTKDHEQCPKGKEAGRGTFEIKDLPAGQYEVVAWHEVYGTVSQNVSVADGETKEIVFTFKKPAKKAEAQSPSRTLVLTTAGDVAGR